MPNLLVGTYGEAGENLHCLEVDAGTGALKHRWGAHAGPNPSFLAMRDGVLYVANELEDRSRLSMWRPGAEGLAPLGYAEGPGAGSCHVALWPDAPYATVANYNSGSFSTYRTDPATGRVRLVGTHRDAGSGPCANRQAGPHAHSSAFVEDFLIGADLGTDTLYLFRAEDGQLEPHAAVGALAGSGPRHMCFSPRDGVVYVVAELSCQVLVYDWVDRTMVLRQAVSILEGETVGAYAAEVALTPDGRWLVASVRGANHLAVLPVAKGGTLGDPVFYPAGVKGPRHFHILPGGGFVVVAGQDSDEVVSLKWTEGTLSAPVSVVAVRAPACVISAG